jgi:4,5-DOPA dioxygenase extradiol
MNSPIAASPAPQRLPSVFISHGSPMFALEPGIAGPNLGALGRTLPRPAAVLVVSPHWMTHAPQVGTAERPETIHDFGGFPEPLYRLQYPAAGHPALAARALEVLAAAGWAASASPRQGLDHGTWVPLMHLYPQVDVPVFQVSLPARLTAAGAWALGEALAPLASEGVLIVGSGSLTHNLREFFVERRTDNDYVAAFAGWVRQAVLAGDGDALRAVMERAPDAQRAHPTVEHLWPLLVAAGAGAPGAPASVIEGGIEYGMLSMDGFVFGQVGHA